MHPAPKPIPHFIFERAGATRASRPPQWLEELRDKDTNVGAALNSVFYSHQHYSADGIHVSVVDRLLPQMKALGVYPVLNHENRLAEGVKEEVKGAAILLVSKAFLEDPSFSDEVKAAVVKHQVLKLKLMMTTKGLDPGQAAERAEQQLSEPERRALRAAAKI